MTDDTTAGADGREAMSGEQPTKFGEPFPTLPIDDFHAINAATVRHAPTTNADLMHLIRLRPTWETLAPSSVTPHLIRRILSDNTAISVLTDTMAELRIELAAATARAETAEAALLTERKHTDEAIAEARELRAALETLRGQIGEPETEWGHQAIRPDGSLGDVVVNDSEESTRWAMAHMQDNFPGTRFVLKNREVWSAEGPWRDAKEGGEAT